MKLINMEPIIKNLSTMKTQFKYDAIEIDGMIKALREAEEVTAAQQPNDPLTLEELREMDGEPVWVVPLNDFEILPANYLVNAYAEQIVVDKFGAYLDFEDYGKTWLAYRHKTETMKGRIGEQNET